MKTQFHSIFPDQTVEGAESDLRTAKALIEELPLDLEFDTINEPNGTTSFGISYENPEHHSVAIFCAKEVERLWDLHDLSKLPYNLRQEWEAREGEKELEHKGRLD